MSKQTIFHMKEALENILSDTEHMNYGNGVNTDCQMYPDVKLGLEALLEIFETIFASHVSPDQLRSAIEILGYSDGHGEAVAALLNKLLEKSL